MILTRNLCLNRINNVNFSIQKTIDSLIENSKFNETIVKNIDTTLQEMIRILFK